MTPQSSPGRATNADADSQRLVLDFLDGSSFGAAGGGKRIDTHASVIFLGGDRVLKIKRAVRFPFLDYSTLEKRRRACEEELRVNVGNAPEIYRRVIAIARNSNGGFEIGGAGTPVEWAVEMARFDEEKTLDCIARTNSVDLALALATADAILQSHANAPRADGQGWVASIPGIIDRNTEKFYGVHGIDAAAIDRLDAASHDFVTRLGPLLSLRARQGFVRRCHGDLHLANIAQVNGRPVLFDAIEFDPIIATTDILYDLAFTLMDLVHFNQAAAANALFNRYLLGASDENLDALGLLPLFLSICAAIRAHVLFIKSKQGANGEAAWREAKRYFDLAGRLVAPKPSSLVAIGGRSGTGKSILARGLAGLIEPSPGAVIVRSDVVRKRLFNVSETTGLPETAYQADATKRVYQHLLSTAQRILAQGCSVVLDAAYLLEPERAALPGLARQCNTDFVGLFLTTDLATRLARIEGRQNDASDATRDVACKQEIIPTGVMDWHLVDASGSPNDTLCRARRWLNPKPAGGT